MNTGKTNLQIKETISFPVNYDGNQKAVRDLKGKLLCDLKSWENNELLNDPQELLEAIGEKIVKLLNESEANKRNNNIEVELAARKEEIMQFEWD
ncbi:hypothetical protein V5739_08230 [Salinimicrobium sp. TIG7-5_MAKvit]|uniref:hypothetical protein n=1 Tax=Salinimicrobium sp. TIG7-5_MAKvit TaxID=3121289 RepID=UPI003C6DC7CC